MRTIVESIMNSMVDESQDKYESMLMDICQMYTDEMAYDPTKLSDPKIKKAVADFWKAAQGMDADAIPSSPKLKKLIELYNS